MVTDGNRGDKSFSSRFGGMTGRNLLVFSQRDGLSMDVDEVSPDGFRDCVKQGGDLVPETALESAHGSLVAHAPKQKGL